MPYCGCHRTISQRDDMFPVAKIRCRDTQPEYWNMFPVAKIRCRDTQPEYWTISQRDDMFPVAKIRYRDTQPEYWNILSTGTCCVDGKTIPVNNWKNNNDQNTDRLRCLIGHHRGPINIYTYVYTGSFNPSNITALCY